MKELLKLARQTLESYFENKRLEVNEDIKKKYSKKQACFVTLIKNSELRGCIGSIYPHQELWKDVIENTKNAAFSDPRFLPLEKEELKEIKIEISVLSPLKKIDYKNIEELKEKIYKKGVLIKKGFLSATYLPQVWEILKDKDEFLNSLCLKAGLAEDSWKKLRLEVFIYTVKKTIEI